MVNDVMNGEAEPAKLLGFLSSAGGDFWKGGAGGRGSRVFAQQRRGQGRCGPEFSVRSLAVRTGMPRNNGAASAQGEHS